MLSSSFLGVAVVIAPASAAPVVAPFNEPPPPAAASDPPLVGARPLADPAPETPSTAPSDGAAPLEAPPTSTGRDDEPAPKPAQPLAHEPPPPRSVPPDYRHTLMTRLDFLLGPVWRTDQLDTMLTTSLEVGQMNGFAGTFHTTMIIATERDVVRAFDFPIGVGAVARGRLRQKPLYASVGLTAGILVHRAKVDGQVTHRVDPDFQLPIRFAWTIARVGISVAVVQGYSIRSRSYESRGAEVWHRDAYRVGVLIGLHWDRIVGRLKKRSAGG